MTDKPTIEAVTLADITPDAHNANRHTERGEGFVRKSMQKWGFAEAGTLDAENRLISGNLRAEVAADVLDADEAIVIDVDGTKPVYIRRKDINLDTPSGRELAVALNRAAQVSIDFDPAVIQLDIDAGVDLSDWWQPFELEAMNGKPIPDEWREYDETAADDVEFHECPSCGHKWPK